MKDTISNTIHRLIGTASQHFSDTKSEEHTHHLDIHQNPPATNKRKVISQRHTDEDTPHQAIKPHQIYKHLYIILTGKIKIPKT